MFNKSGAFKNFENLTRKKLPWSLFFNKVAGLRPATLSKMRFQFGCFPAHFFRNTFLTEHLRRLLLVILTKFLVFLKDISFCCILFMLYRILKFLYLIVIIIKFSKILNPFVHNVVKCVHIARFLKYVWPFYIIPPSKQKSMERENYTKEPSKTGNRYFWT